MSNVTEFEKEKLSYEVLSEENAKKAQEKIRAIIENVETVITGKREKVELTVLAMLAGGHVLIEDVPGTGKTSLVSALAKTIACNYSRIQFTPDVMPSDVTGFSIYNQKTGEFEFRPGAAMSNIVLADEINRASAKTQSAMLEIMEERQVTVDANTYKMEDPFIVLATQNPIESLGTYQLPEAQIDRFMIKISLGYPELMDEVSIIMHGKKAKSKIASVISAQEVRQLIQDTNHIKVSRLVSTYIVHIIAATRTNADIKLGSSPRGSIALYALARAYAMYNGRNYVIPDDVKYLAPYVLAHRITLTHAAKTEKKNPVDIIRKIVSSVVVPVTKEDLEV
ncbi:AAA family ATPase [Eubacterium oxidoreducens]|uniref:MoxR-like ATPase n=1 Tax=Eubacterium oxidoreducens TaxID=1732 RepID=A0A1G5ZZY5_EUBOX|nr:MoxR family ATPase [Eubacterium oxidoreducens]SDB01758.1 MoxR-like ATPase [Eubacterium oxidoreducens]